MKTHHEMRKNRVPVGETPVPKYTSWDAHREAMRQEALGRRRAAKRLIEAIPTPR